MKCLLLIITRYRQPKRDVSWTEGLYARKEGEFPICKTIIIFLTYNFSDFYQNFLLFDTVRNAFPIDNYKRLFSVLVLLKSAF